MKSLQGISIGDCLVTEVVQVVAQLAWLLQSIDASRRVNRQENNTIFCMFLFYFLKLMQNSYVGSIYQSTMLIDLALQQEPLDKLVSSFIELQYKQSGTSLHIRSKKETVILNSILVTLSSKKYGLKQVLNEVKYSLQVNENDKKCMQRAGMLLGELVKRSQHSITSASQDVIKEIVELSIQKAFIAVCGNSFIALLNQIFRRLNMSQANELGLKLYDFLIHPKLLVSTYRQQTRLCIYQLYLNALKNYSHLLKTSDKVAHNEVKFISKCINSGSGQKDPRNIGNVFQLYLKILEVFPEQNLAEYRNQMYQNLEAYYPIQFVGDDENQEHRKINVKQISSLLDQCLTHSFFKQLTWQLISTKTAAPPIAPFLATFMLYLRERNKDSQPQFLLFRLKNMLLRLSEDDFIAQDYDDSQYDLGNLFVTILDIVFCREDQTYSIAGYEIIMIWLERMVGKIIQGNCKHSGTMIGLFRSIVKNSKKPRFRTLIEMFRNYALRKVLKSLQNDDDIIPKLGLVIVALSDITFVSQELEQIVSLLILQIGKLYPEVNDDVKMLLLKILLQAFKGYSNNRMMVRSTNDSYILKDCLSRAKWAFGEAIDSTQAYIIKAFIDFIATVYLNKTQQILQNIQGLNFQLQTYLLGQMFQNLDKEENTSTQKDIILKKFDMLTSKVTSTKQKDEIFNALKSMSLNCCINLLSSIVWTKDNKNIKLLLSLIIELRSHFSKQLQNLSNQQSNQKGTQSVLSNYFEPFSQNSNSEITTLQRLWSECSQDSEEILFPSLNNVHKLNLQTFKFEETLIRGYEPTFIHWLWQNLKVIEPVQKKEKTASQLLKHLPEKLLLRDSKLILQLLLKSQEQGASLLKIVDHLNIKALRETGIVEYCLKQLQAMCQSPERLQKTTESSVCILATIITIVEKDDEGQVKKSLYKRQRQLRKLGLHRKRPIRQAVRKILLILQEL